MYWNLLLRKEKQNEYAPSWKKCIVGALAIKKVSFCRVVTLNTYFFLNKDLFNTFAMLYIGFIFVNIKSLLEAKHYIGFIFVNIPYGDECKINSTHPSNSFTHTLPYCLNIDWMLTSSKKRGIKRLLPNKGFWVSLIQTVLMNFA